MRIREMINAIWPVTKKEFTESMTEMTKKHLQLERELNELIGLHKSLIAALNEMQIEQKKKNSLLIEALCQENRDSDEKYQDIKQTMVSLLENRSEQSAFNKQIINMLRMNKRFCEEIIWANVFHDAINETEWLKRNDLNPGRWAIGYQTLYVLYRILNEINPQCILELGLGESTKLISQYVNLKENVIHNVVEHDVDWVKIFSQRVELSDKTKVVIKELSEDGELNGVYGIREYSAFESKIMPRKYDLIVIDAPWGGDMSDYARIDVAKIMPECLAQSFVILIDDYNRVGEQHTVEYMKQILQNNGIEYSISKYEGAKDLAVITSKDLKFLCTL